MPSKTGAVSLIEAAFAAGERVARELDIHAVVIICRIDEPTTEYGTHTRVVGACSNPITVIEAQVGNLLFSASQATDCEGIEGTIVFVSCLSKDEAHQIKNAVEAVLLPVTEEEDPE